jgi:hypothetical protein
MIVKSWPMLMGLSIVFVTLGFALVSLVMRLLRSNREQIVASGSLVAEQEIAIREPGELVLLLETPRFRSDYRTLEFEIVEQATGQATTMKYGVLGGQGAVYGVRTMRVPIGRTTLQRPGAYLVRVAGLRAEKDYSSCHLLLSRPYLGRMVLQIAGIVVCAIAMLLSLLLILWQVLPLQQNG